MKKLKSLMKHFVISIKISFKVSALLFCCRIILEILMVISPIIVTYLTKLIIDILGNSLSNDTGQKNSFFIVVIILVSIQILNMLVGRINSFFTANHTELVSHQIQLQILHKANELDISYYDNPKFHNEIQNVNRDSQAMLSLTWLIIAIIKGVVLIFTCGVILGRLNFLVPLIILILNIPSAFIDKYISKKKYDWERSKTTNERRINYIKGILNSRQYSKDVRVFYITDYLFEKFEKMWKVWFVEKKKIDQSKVTFSFIAGMLPYGATMLVFIYVGLLILSKKLTIGDFTYYTGISSQFVSGIAMFLTSVNQGYESEMRLSNYTNFLKWKSIIDETGKEELTQVNDIEFKNVTFYYPNTKTKVLDKISFNIEKNDKVALVGLNGAGKSTIIKLLLRLYDPTSGTISINGRDIKAYNKQSVLKNIGVVFQDFNKYDLSLKENVALAELSNIEDVTKIEEALKHADIHFNQGLKQGLETQLGKTFDDDGIELSGGQWQKISISQAYFKTSSFILMDEPNASLDPEAEYKFFQNMKDICEDKGAIYVTHRMSSVLIADKIIVLDMGRCIEIGTHKELMDKKGIYRDLFLKQAENYTILQ